MDARLPRGCAASRCQGPPSQRGDACPSDKCSTCQPLMTLDLYGRRDCVRLVQTTACVYAAPNRLLRVVAVEGIGT